jgi:hypothetical protein
MTALQQLIDWIKASDDNHVAEILQKAEDLLETERETIVNSFESGQKDTANGFFIKSGNSYYEKKYEIRNRDTDT